MNDDSTSSPQPGPFRIWDAIALPSVTNALLAIVISLLLGTITSAMVLRETPTYRSTALLQVDQPLAIAASGDPGIIDKLNRLLPKYAILVLTAKIVGPVAERTGLPPGEVASSVTAGPLGKSLLLNIAAQNPDRAHAQTIAQATADEIAAYASREQEANAIPPQQRFTLTPIQAAGPGTKISPTRDDATASGSVAALVGLAIAYVLLQLVTARRRL